MRRLNSAAVIKGCSVWWVGGCHHYKFVEPKKNRPKGMSAVLEVRAKNMQVDSGEFDVQAGKENKAKIAMTRQNTTSTTRGQSASNRKVSEHCRRRHTGQDKDLGTENGQIAEVDAPGIRDAIVWWVGLVKA